MRPPEGRASHSGKGERTLGFWFAIEFIGRGVRK